MGHLMFTFKYLGEDHVRKILLYLIHIPFLSSGVWDLFLRKSTHFSSYLISCIWLRALTSYHMIHLLSPYSHSQGGWAEAEPNSRFWVTLHSVSSISNVQTTKESRQGGGEVEKKNKNKQKRQYLPKMAKLACHLQLGLETEIWERNRTTAKSKEAKARKILTFDPMGEKKREKQYSVHR